ncbi:MAG: DNA polymerase III subunit alpha [Paludibacteraceae bacterium]|nr:DNA polymerase III subunit alpha [Paludibacteraceae bacterium]
MPFIHLHVHSHYSILDGMSKVPDLVDKCLRTGMTALALTDHGNMYGIKELLDYSKKVNKKAQEEAGDPTLCVFKPIVGCEVYCARRGRKSKTNEEATAPNGKKYNIDRSGWHLILLAKNMQGYHNLCHLVSEGFMDDAYYHTPRIDHELLEQYHEGLICSSACLAGEVARKINYGDIQGAEESVQWFKSLFGDDYYLELQRHQTDKPNGNQDVYQAQMKVNPVLIDLARKYDVKLIATNDVHFVEEEHAEAHDRLLCISTGAKFDDPDRLHYTKQEWLKTPEEMAAIFADIPEAIANTQEIADKVEVYDIDSDPIMPKFSIPESFGTEESYRQRFTEQQLFDEFTRNENGEVVMDEKAAQKKVKKMGGIDKLYRIKLEADYLEYLTMQGAEKRYGKERLETDEELKERIRFELHTMKSMGFPGYFLIVMDFIRGAREELGVSVGPGRGSAAGSVVAYCLHITDLDPLRYDLLFERFLNPDRISLPDIDTDFDDAGRGRVLDWVSQKYGETHVAHIITYGVMAAKSAIADVGRLHGIPLPVVNQIKALIPDRGFPDNVKDEKGKSPKVNLKNCYKYVPELKKMYEEGEPEIRSMLTYAQQLEGTIRQVGIHACGVIIGADDLTKFAPLSSIEDKQEKKRVLVTEYDGHVVESVGLIKMDFLGLKTLTIIRECLDNIRKARGEEVDIDHIPLDDADTYRLFQEGRTVAVFQFESAGMQKYLKELRPTVIGDLIAMNALYRPGPMQYIPQFIRRKHGEEPVTYDIPVMEKYLKDTYGVTVYQEQVMLLSRLLANFTRGESDKLRKAMGKKQMAVLQELKGKFMDGGKANGHDEKILDKIWKDWEAFASYAFNKSHAACYSWVAYQTGYLKAHYPAEFMAANLTISKDDIKEVTKFMDECKALHIKVLEPDVNESEMNFTVNKQGDIRFGLGGIKGVGEGAVEAILEERKKNGKYQSVYDFVERVNLQSCNRKTLEWLVTGGAFDCFTDVYREQLLGINDRGEYVLDALIRYGNMYQQDRQLQRNSLFGDMAGSEVTIAKPEMPLSIPRMSPIERLNKEKDLIGIYLSAHPLDEYEFEMQHLTTLTCEDMQRFDGWRSPESRAAAARAAETSSAGDNASDSLPTDDDDSSTVEDASQSINPNEWILQHSKEPIRIGGIITSEEQAISKNGNPYGRYTIEDYNGSYKFALFGNTYQQFAPMLKKNVYAMLSGTIRQRGAGRQYFKPEPIDKAEYEFNLTQVDLLQDAQKKYVHTLVLQVPVENATAELGDLLVKGFSQKTKDTKRKDKSEVVQDAVSVPLKVQLIDSKHNDSVTTLSNQMKVSISRAVYLFLRDLQNEGRLNYSIS